MNVLRDVILMQNIHILISTLSHVTAKHMCVWSSAVQ